MICGLALSALTASSPAAAQGSPTEDASSTAPVATSAPPPNPMVVPTATATATTPSNDRPARGPALRERAGRRSRGGSAASGALFVVILVGAIGYYVVKRLRR